MKVNTAKEHLARIPMPKTEQEFEAAWERTEQLRKWVEHSSDSREAKEQFNAAISRKQEELEGYWRSRKSA